MTKQKLAEGGVAIGCTINFLHPGLAEFVGQLGFDVLVADGEHGAMTDNGVEALGMAGRAAGIDTLVRLPAASGDIARFLDIGVSGVQVPRVSGEEDAKVVIGAMKFPPGGNRGFGSSRANNYGMRPGGASAFMEAANRDSILMIQLEDAEAIGNLPELLALEEIDVFLIGEVDLSVSLGYPGEVHHPAVAELVDRAIGQIVSAGRIAGLAAGTASEAEKATDRGARYLLTSAARLVALGAKSVLDWRSDRNA